MNRLMFVFGAVVPLLAQAATVIPSGTTRHITSEEDVAVLKAEGDILIESGATLEFNIPTSNLGTPKLKGAGTVLVNCDNSASLNATWDASELMGALVVSNNSQITVGGPLCFGRAKVTVYASSRHSFGAVYFGSFGSGTYANDFELHGSLAPERSFNACLYANASDVFITGNVVAYGENSAVCVTSGSGAGRTQGQIRFLGNFTKASGNVLGRMASENGAGLPRNVFGNGTSGSIIDLGGYSSGYLGQDGSLCANVIAGSVVNGKIQLMYGSRWQLAVDDPICDTSTSKACFEWLSGHTGWVDLNGHHLRVGASDSVQYNYWDINFTATDVRGGGFCNNSEKASTLLVRQMFAGISNDKPIRLEMNGNLNVEYDSSFNFSAYPQTSGNDFGSSWSCWLGNYPNASSSMRGSVIATKATVHMASSANYPNVSKLLAKTTGAVYVHAGATLNPNVALCVEGNGRIYLQQDITVSYIAVDGKVVEMAPGEYTTDDFDCLYSFAGSSGGNPTIEGSRKVTITGVVSPVAKVGLELFGTFNDAVSGANGEVIDLLANASYTPSMDFKVRKGAFSLASDGSAFVGYASEMTVNGVTAFVYRRRPTFSGGDGDTSVTPYRMMTADDLKELAYWVGDGESFIGKFFRQGGTIAWDSAVDGAFAGVGTYNSDTACFAGTYDGAGNTLSGIQFTDRKYAGLFNQVVGGKIENLTMNGVSFVGEAGEYGGAAFVGNAAGGARLVGLVAKGNIGTMDKPLPHSAAGIVYRATNTSIVSCTNEATVVSSNSKVAGILGITQNEQEKGVVSIEDCVNAGAVVQKGCTTQDGGVGGILAYAWHGTAYDDKGMSGISILNCANKGTVSSDFATCYLGSIVGNAYGDIPIVCSGCTAQSNVKSVGNVSKANGCLGLTGATVDGAVANFLSFSGGVSGDCNCRLMCDAKEDIVLNEKTAKLTFDLSLGAVYCGTVSFDGKRVNGVLKDCTHVVFSKDWGLVIVVR